MTMARTGTDILFRLMKECQFFSCAFNTENRLFSFKIPWSRIMPFLTQLRYIPIYQPLKQHRWRTATFPQRHIAEKPTELRRKAIGISPKSRQHIGDKPTRFRRNQHVQSPISPAYNAKKLLSDRTIRVSRSILSHSLFKNEANRQQRFVEYFQHIIHVISPIHLNVLLPQGQDQKQKYEQK